MALEHLSVEADRQLSEQRAQADAFATRSGLMTAATALLTGLLANADQKSSFAGPLIWVIAVSAAVGILVLWLSRLLLGPSPSQLSRWRVQGGDGDLLDAKLLTIEANARALLRTELAFAVQALLTVLGIALLILKIREGAP